jgi:hypothetical protein
MLGVVSAGGVLAALLIPRPPLRHVPDVISAAAAQRRARPSRHRRWCGAGCDASRGYRSSLGPSEVVGRGADPRSRPWNRASPAARRAIHPCAPALPRPDDPHRHAPVRPAECSSARDRWCWCARRSPHRRRRPEHGAITAQALIVSGAEPGANPGITCDQSERMRAVGSGHQIRRQEVPSQASRSGRDLNRSTSHSPTASASSVEIAEMP